MRIFLFLSAIYLFAPPLALAEDFDALRRALTARMPQGCHRLSRDEARLRQLGADLYRELLLLPTNDEPAFLRGIKDLLRRAWSEHCRAV